MGNTASCPSVTANPDWGKGGGLYLGGESTLVNVTVEGNLAKYGGGIYGNDQNVVLYNSTINANTAEDDGGGIHNCSGLTVVNSVVSRNNAVLGAGIYNTAHWGDLTVTNCTIAHNIASGYGGGICNDQPLWPSFYRMYDFATAAIYNSVIALNSAGTGNDLYRAKDFWDRGSILFGAHNLIGNADDPIPLVDGENGNLVGTPENPIDPLLSEWTQLDNGQWGYRLLEGSLAHDAGNRILAVDAEGERLVEDMTGAARLQDETVDMGAVEGESDATAGRTYVVTSLEPTIDAADGELTFFEAYEAANRNQPVGDAPAGSFSEKDVIRFADGLQGTISLGGEALRVLGSLAVEGPGPDALAFDAQGESRVFVVEQFVECDLSGITVTGGFAQIGGGIHTRGTLTLTNAHVTANTRIQERGSR